MFCPTTLITSFVTAAEAVGFLLLRRGRESFALNRKYASITDNRRLTGESCELRAKSGFSMCDPSGQPPTGRTCSGHKPNVRCLTLAWHSWRHEKAAIGVQRE